MTVQGDAVQEGELPQHLGVRKALATAAIIALLTAIVWPLIVDQRKKAVDADVKTDVTAVEEAIGQYIAEHDATPNFTMDDRSVQLDGREVAVLHRDATEVSFTADSTTAWCVAATNPNGKHAAESGYRYKASKEKVDTGDCS